MKIQDIDKLEQKILGNAGLIVMKKAQDWLDLHTKGTGHLAKSIHFRIEGNTVHVGTDMEYAKYLEWGTGVYGPAGQPIFPKNKAVLAWTDQGVSRPGANDKQAWQALRKSGQAHFAMYVKGIKPMHFLRNAAVNSKEDIINMVKATMAKGG